MKTWKPTWNASKQPRKQRVYVYRAPLHVKREFLASHLSKELRAKHNKRSIPIRKGDKVKVMRGTHQGKTGKVERVDVKRTTIYITGIDVIKKDGSKTLLPFHPSKLLIQELDLTDKRRVEMKK